jgi:hypothetical protein
MKRASVPYTSTVVGQDISIEEFKKLYPNASGFPYVIVDGEPLGGIMETIKLFVDKGLVSSKKK